MHDETPLRHDEAGEIRRSRGRTQAGHQIIRLSLSIMSNVALEQPRNVQNYPFNNHSENEMKHDDKIDSRGFDSREIDLDGAFNDGFKAHWWDTHWAVAFWLLVILSCIAPFAFADDLTYQSQTLAGTDTQTDGPSVGTSPDSDAYIVDVKVSGPLAPNLNMAMVTPQSWVVTCTRCYSNLTSAPTGLAANAITSASAVFMFSTDSTGKITAWNFSIAGSFELIDPTSQVPCCLTQSNGTFSSGDTATGWQYMDGHIYTQSLSAPKGTWTQSSLSNPPVSAPAPVVAANVQLRTCNSTWGPVSNSVPAGVTANASGAGLSCTGALKNSSGAYYTKITRDKGATFQYVTLRSLGLGNGT